MPTIVTAAGTEVLVSEGAGTKVSSFGLETVAAPIRPLIRTHALSSEALVSPSFATTIRGLGLEVVVAPTLFPDGGESLITSLEIESVVTSSTKNTLATGVFAEDIHGWIYDRRTLEKESELATRYNTFIGGQNFGLTDFLPQDYFQSGYEIGLKYKDTLRRILNDKTLWTPQVGTGLYSLYWDSRRLFSDSSVVGKFSADAVVNNSMVLDLDPECRVDTLEVALWQRRNGLIYKANSYLFVDEFTGEINSSTNTRYETNNTDNFSERRYEFRVDGTKVYLNNSTPKVIGDPDKVFSAARTSLSTLRNVWDYQESGNDKGRVLFARFFPLETSSVRLISFGTGANVEWTETQNLSLAGPDDRVFQVDYDLGRIIIGGYRAPDLYLKQPLEPYEDSIIVYEGEALNAYPEKGILIIDNEKIYYNEKTKYGFTNCLRAYDNTELSSSLPIGSLVEHQQAGFGTGGELAISYKAVPRIEYEISSNETRTANAVPLLDVNPQNNVKSNSVLQILPADKNLARIVLSTDAPKIGGNLYGPLYFGTDVAKLTATAYDNFDLPVEDIKLTIEILEGPGFLNNTARSFSAISNSLGQIYAYYNSPYDKSSFEKLVTNVTYDSGDTLITLNKIDTVADLNDVWIFQVLKHDQIIGSKGLTLEVLDEDTSISMPHGRHALHLDGYLNAGDYTDGWIYIYGSDNVSRYRNIVSVWEDVDGDDRPITVIGLDAPLPASTSVGETLRIFKFDETEWNASALNGVRSILYRWSEEVEHPITGEVGAYSPIHPSSISGNTLRFADILLPDPAPADNSVNLGAYSIVLPEEVSFRAYGTDPITGRLIRSNVIRISMKLPLALTGVDYSGTLPVPHGWKFPTQEYNTGAGLGIANFITINPGANLVDTFTITGEF